MNTKRKWEIGATTLVGIAVFGWTFGQSPGPNQFTSKKSARQQIAVSQIGKRGDKSPPVVQPAPRQLNIATESIALQTPDQALRPAANLYQVMPANLKLRSGPSSTTQLINVYSRGATFEKIGQDGNWLQVRSTDDGNSGWMFSDYLQAQN